MHHLYTILACILLGFSFHQIGTLLSALTAWIAVCLLIGKVKQISPQNFFIPLLSLLVGGILMSAIMYSWMPQTLITVTNGSNILSVTLTLFFYIYTALQLVLFAFIYYRLPQWLSPFYLKAPLSWTFVYQIIPWYFEWQIADTQIALLPFAQIYDIGGAALAGFIMFWWCETITTFILWLLPKEDSRDFEDWHIQLGALALSMLLVFGYGFIRSIQIERTTSIAADTSWQLILFQPNVPLYHLQSAKDVIQHQKWLSYQSKKYHQPNTLIVWPEGSLHMWLPQQLKNGKNLISWATEQEGASYIIGASTVGKKKIYNSAIGMGANAEFIGFYNKRELVPFAESRPLGNTFRLGASRIHYSPGDNSEVMSFSSWTKSSLLVGSLICYEDMKPWLARQSVADGAEVLGVITNEAWFSSQTALRQHLHLARARAIETRRYLFRSANTGITALVSPTGKLEAWLPPHQESVLESQVTPLAIKSQYVIWGHWIGSIIALITMIILIIPFTKRADTY